MTDPTTQIRIGKISRTWRVPDRTSQREAESVHEIVISYYSIHRWFNAPGTPCWRSKRLAVPILVRKITSEQGNRWTRCLSGAGARGCIVPRRKCAFSRWTESKLLAHSTDLRNGRIRIRIRRRRAISSDTLVSNLVYLRRGLFGPLLRGFNFFLSFTSSFVSWNFLLSLFLDLEI